MRFHEINPLLAPHSRQVSLWSSQERGDASDAISIPAASGIDLGRLKWHFILLNWRFFYIIRSTAVKNIEYLVERRRWPLSLMNAYYAMGDLIKKLFVLAALWSSTFFFLNMK